MFRYFMLFNAMFPRHRIFTATVAWRPVDTYRRAHRMVPTCRPEKAARFVFRDGLSMRP